jgi:tRNA modification GTPase
MASTEDTIAAIATPTGRGGIGIVRMSGPGSMSIVKAMTNRVPQQRQADYVVFKDSHNEIIDRGIVIFFNGPHSFTGEDIVELHGHGGSVVLNSLLNETIAQGARQARPGEFSERAFMNDKIDLVQAEAIADLISSASEQAARSAVRSLDGEFSKQINTIRDELISIRVFTEGSLDFPDEEIDFLSESEVVKNTEQCLAGIQSLLRHAERGRILNEGIRVAIIGRPNVGKSSLLNCMTESDRAIVTDVPGTTRDIIEDRILIDGANISIVDTAGVHDSTDIIEAEGIKRTLDQITTADVLLMVSEHRVAAKNEQLDEALENKKVIYVENKIDLHNRAAFVENKGGVIRVGVSAKNTEGISLLKQELSKLVGLENMGEDVVLARSRHIEALKKAEGHLLKGLNKLRESKAAELFAQDLNSAQNELGKITGVFCADDLLGEIFSRFCIGK